MKQILLILLSFVVIRNAQGQNSSEFFKTIPNLTEDTPEWARLMY